MVLPIADKEGWGTYSKHEFPPPLRKVSSETIDDTSDLQSIQLQLEVGAKPVAEYLERPIRPSERPRVPVDVGSCYRLIPTDFVADFLDNLSFAIHEAVASSA